MSSESIANLGLPLCIFALILIAGALVACFWPREVHIDYPDDELDLRGRLRR